MVVEHAEGSGTHDGPFFGLPPTHTPIAVSAIVKMRLTPEGKIAERSGVFKLGVILVHVLPGVISGALAVRYLKQRRRGVRSPTA